MTTATRTLWIADGRPEVLILCPHGLPETPIDVVADRMAQRAVIVGVERNHVRQYACDCTEIIELARKLPAAVYSADYDPRR
jgi:hypothetical protein